jgi:hypothetical protein
MADQNRNSSEQEQEYGDQSQTSHDSSERERMSGEPASVADDRGRDMGNFSEDRESDELGGELESDTIDDFGDDDSDGSTRSNR